MPITSAPDSAMRFVRYPVPQPKSKTLSLRLGDNKSTRSSPYLKTKECLSLYNFASQPISRAGGVCKLLSLLISVNGIDIFNLSRFDRKRLISILFPPRCNPEAPSGIHYFLFPPSLRANKLLGDLSLLLMSL